MASVTGRVKEFKQPRGGFLKPSSFKIFQLEDEFTLHDVENVHGTIIGMAVDYLTRFITGADILEAFQVSIKGALIAEEMGLSGVTDVIAELMDGITCLDDVSIVNACKMVTFDVWSRNIMNAIMATPYDEINPDKNTIENIRVYVKRGVNFFNKYGPILQDGFTFEPLEKDSEAYERMIATGQGSYGGYTSVVSSGDGDFLTKNTLWDFKVSKAKPNSQHTLQLLMYWIMGQHSGQDIYKDITHIGIYNPRLNLVYMQDMREVLNTPGLFEPPVRSLRATLPFRTEPSFR